MRPERFNDAHIPASVTHISKTHRVFAEVVNLRYIAASERNACTAFIIFAVFGYS